MPIIISQFLGIYWHIVLGISIMGYGSTVFLIPIDRTIITKNHSLTVQQLVTTAV